MFRRGDHVGPPLRLMVLFIMVCRGGFPTPTVLYCFLSCFVWATWERPYNITSMFTGLRKPPAPPNHVIFPSRRTTAIRAPPPPPPPSRFTTYHYSSAGRLRCAAYVRNLRNSGAIAVIESTSMTAKCDILHRPLRLFVICVASRKADAIRSYIGLSIDMRIRTGRPRRSPLRYYRFLCCFV